MKDSVKLLILLAFCLSFITCNNKQNNNQKEKLTFEIDNSRINSPDLVRFIVISETHFGNSNAKDKVYNSLKNLLSKYEHFDAIFVTGDLTEWGSASQYDDLKEVFDSVVPTEIPVYYMLGNHDHFSENGIETYLEKMEQNGLHQYVSIHEYPFITLSMRGMFARHFSQEDKEFLKYSLMDAHTNFPEKPIFFFTHIGMENTVYGTSTGENFGTNILDSLLIEYPQIIAFSGHSHFPLGDPRSIHQDKITSVNTGNTSYCEFEKGFSEGIYPPRHQEVSEGIIVKIKENNDVEIERWDTYRDEEISPRWFIKAPHDGTAFHYKNRTGGKAPEFKDEVKIEVIEKGEEGYLVTFPQAQDDELVHHYLIEVLNSKGEVVLKDNRFSQFYLNSQMPEELSTVLFGLPTNSILTVRVSAVDSYGNKSVFPLISEPFATKAYTPASTTKLPVADLFNVIFTEKGNAKDISPNNMKVTHGPLKPETYFNSTYNRYAAKFNGKSTCYYKIDYRNNNPIKNAFYNEFTLETVYKSNSTKNMCPLSAQQYGGAGIEQASGGQIEFWAYIDKNYIKVLPLYTIEPGRYYHIVAMRDSEKMYLYVNGQKVGETEASGSLSLPNNTKTHWICIGGDTFTDHAQYSLNGEVAVARMYSRVLSRDEIYSLFQEFTKETDM